MLLGPYLLPSAWAISLSPEGFLPQVLAESPKALSSLGFSLKPWRTVRPGNAGGYMLPWPMSDKSLLPFWSSAERCLLHRVSEWVKSLSHVLLFATPWAVACTSLLRPWDFLGESTGVGCHFLFQGIFPNQGSDPGLLHCRQTLYRLSHQGSCFLL